MNFVFNGIITRTVIRNALEQKHACNNTYLNTSEMRVTMVFLRTFQLSLLIKRILKILTAKLLATYPNTGT